MGGGGGTKAGARGGGGGATGRSAEKAGPAIKAKAIAKISRRIGDLLL